jgi:hypothetical protein
MDRQGKSTGIKKIARLSDLKIVRSNANTTSRPQAKSPSKSGVSATISNNFSFRLRKCGNYRYLLVHPQRTNYNASDKKN